MKQKNEGYSEAIRESWLADIKNELSRQKCAVWVQYAYQLEEMDSTGTISDRRLYLNRSNYDKLPVLWKKDLDVYLDDCSSRYTIRTLALTRIYCSEGLLFGDDMGVHGITDITYDAVIKLIRTNMYCSADTKVAILNNTARMIRFYGEKGLCPINYSLVFNCQIYPHIGSVSEFSDENRIALDKITDVTMSADEFCKSVTPFIELLETHGYVGTTLKLARHALTAFVYNEGILHHEEGIDIIPTNIELSGMEISLVNAMSREQTLKLYLADLKKDYDYILIDCMPSLGMLTINALAAADSVIVPVQAHYLPLKGMTQLMKTIGKVQRQLNPNLKIDGVLLTLADMRTKLARTTEDSLRENYGKHIRIFKTVIPVAITAAESSAAGQSIYEYDKNGTVAKAYAEFTREVIQCGEKQRNKHESSLSR